MEFDFISSLAFRGAVAATLLVIAAYLFLCFLRSGYAPENGTVINLGHHKVRYEEEEPETPPKDKTRQKHIRSGRKWGELRKDE